MAFGVDHRGQEFRNSKNTRLFTASGGLAQSAATTISATAREKKTDQRRENPKSMS
jgi:hypothetical protein